MSTEGDVASTFDFYSSLAEPKQKDTKRSKCSSSNTKRQRSKIITSVPKEECTKRELSKRKSLEKEIADAASALRRQSRMIHLSKRKLVGDGTFGPVTPIKSPSQRSSLSSPRFEKKEGLDLRQSNADQEISEQDLNDHQQQSKTSKTEQTRSLSIHDKANRFRETKTAAILASKSEVSVVEGGACDFVSIRLSLPPSHPVLVEVLDKSGQVRIYPKIIRFDADEASRRSRVSEVHKNIDAVPGVQWFTTQRIRVSAVDDDNAEDLLDTCELTFRAHSNDHRYSSHPVRGSVRCDPETIKVSVVDNDGKYIYSFGDQFGPYGFGMPVHVRQYPMRVNIENKTYTNEPPVTSRRKRSLEKFVDSFGNVIPRYALPRARELPNASALEAPEQPIDQAKAAKGSLQIPLPSKLRAVACGGFHAVVINANGMVFNCGAGEGGQLGHGTTRSQQSMTPWEGVDSDGELRSVVRAASCGKLHTVLVTDDGQVVCCGSNDHGQLGTGMDDVSTAKEHHSPSSRKRSRLQTIPTNQPQVYQETQRKLSIQEDEPVCASPARRRPSQDGSGERHVPQMSLTREFLATTAAASETLIPCEFAVIPRLVKGLCRVRVIQVACGDNHTLAIALASGKTGDTCQVFGWGEGAYGALGRSCQKVQATPVALEELRDKDPYRIACGSLHSAVLCSAGELYTSGFDSNGRLGRRPSAKGHTHAFRHVPVLDSAPGGGTCPVSFTDVSCGGGHTGVLSDRRELWVCGVNAYGQLGLGDHDDRWTLTKVEFLSKHEPCAISFGYFHSCAISTSGNMFVWGCNDQGQLGLGPNCLSQPLPRLQEHLVGLNVVQAQTGRGFTTVLTQMTVEHLALLYQQDERAFIEKKRELNMLQREEMKRLKEAQRQLVLEHRKKKERHRQLLAVRHAEQLEPKSSARQDGLGSASTFLPMQVAKLQLCLQKNAFSLLEGQGASAPKTRTFISERRRFGGGNDVKPSIPSMPFTAHLQYGRLSRPALTKAFVDLRRSSTFISHQKQSNELGEGEGNRKDGRTPGGAAIDLAVNRKSSSSELTNENVTESCERLTGHRTTVQMSKVNLPRDTPEPTSNLQNHKRKTSQTPPSKRDEQSRNSRNNKKSKRPLAMKRFGHPQRKIVEIKSMYRKPKVNKRQRKHLNKEESSPPQQWLDLLAKLNHLGFNR